MGDENICIMHRGIPRNHPRGGAPELLENLATWSQIVRPETEKLTPREGWQRRARFYNSVRIPDLFFSQEDFPALCSHETSHERREALKRCLATEDSSSPGRQNESAMCCERVLEVLDWFVSENIMLFRSSDGQDKYLYRLISTICDVPWLAGKVVVGPSDFSGEGEQTLLASDAEAPLGSKEMDADTPKEVGGIAEMFPCLSSVSNYLALTAATWKHKGWTLDSTGTATPAFLYAYAPYLRVTLEILQITLKASGPPEYNPFFRRMIDLTQPSDIYDLHKLLLWIANENGGRLQVRQSLAASLILKQKEDEYEEEEEEEDESQRVHVGYFFTAAECI
eukprot:Gregarina_sp_Pseudo_9__1164@NODE_1767_length_1343_cov_5_742331_g1637_i0_p1_GENE_NODE_1767_length_1343_cov_5_742331_g1637_i0NODE_1767_length_1343_cov_5_742331_g1637_i0_p1_ORF_typecomplete_len338_score30_54_NODE_1767_length_1343_cov_5_742331_g1637_i03291342